VGLVDEPREPSDFGVAGRVGAAAGGDDHHHLRRLPPAGDERACGLTGAIAEQASDVVRGRPAAAVDAERQADVQPRAGQASVVERQRKKDETAGAAADELAREARQGIVRCGEVTRLDVVLKLACQRRGQATNRVAGAREVTAEQHGSGHVSTAVLRHSRWHRGRPW
jgi:hypothetical protein